MWMCKFGQNPPIGSEDRVQTRSYVDADDGGIHTKSNIHPLPFGWGDVIASTHVSQFFDDAWLLMGCLNVAFFL